MEHLVTDPGNVSTLRRVPTPQEINSKAGNTIQCHMDFVWELNGGKGHGHVPKDPEQRARYFEGVRRILTKEYGFSARDIAVLTEKQRRCPAEARAMLMKHRTSPPTMS